jgi:hypothetical protein
MHAGPIYKFSMFRMKQLQLLSLAILLFSCKKEFEDAPYNSIERFTVTDPASGTSYRAVIKDDTLLVYWAQFAAMPDSISPEIIVAEHAAITPASGVKVAFSETTTYKVVAQNGSTKNYVLKPLSNQPPPTYEIFTPDLLPGDLLVIGGEYFIPDTVQTKLYLVNSTTQVQIPGASFSLLTNAEIDANIPADIPAGTYDLKLVTGKRTAIKGPVNVN